MKRIRSFRLEKDYQIIRKEEQEEQIEIRVKSRRKTFLRAFRFRFSAIEKRESSAETTRR